MIERRAKTQFLICISSSSSCSSSSSQAILLAQHSTTATLCSPANREPRQSWIFTEFRTLMLRVARIARWLSSTGTHQAGPFKAPLARVACWSKGACGSGHFYDPHSSWFLMNVQFKQWLVVIRSEMWLQTWNSLPKNTRTMDNWIIYASDAIYIIQTYYTLSRNSRRFLFFPH